MTTTDAEGSAPVRPVPVDHSASIGDTSAEAMLVPRAMRIAGAWSWRICVIVLALIPIGWVVSQASILVIPVFVAALLAALLLPLYKRLLGWRWPKALALVATLLVLFVAVGTLLALVTTQLAGGLDLDMARLQQQYQVALEWLRNSPLHVTEDQITAAVGEVVEWVQGNVSSLLSQVLSAGSTMVSLATGTLVTIFALIFFLLDGRRIWMFIVSLFPRPARAAVDGAAQRGWVSIGHYARVQVVVALIDAIGITLGALLLGVPFAIPIGIIVFLAAFVPFIGAIVSGGLAVLVALIYNDIWNALIMLAVVVAVMQIEAHILQPLIMGNAVKLHPLAVLLSVSAGSLFGGIAGAVFAVPLVAASKVAIQYIASEDWRGRPDPTKLDPEAPRPVELEDDPAAPDVPAEAEDRARRGPDADAEGAAPGIEAAAPEAEAPGGAHAAPRGPGAGPDETDDEHDEEPR